MIKRWIGIDGFDLLVQVGITGMIMIIVDTASHSPDSEGALAAVVACSLGVLAWRRSRALKQRPPETTGDYQAERITTLEDRVAELEQGQSRIFELEERLEFTERLLVQVREQNDARVLPGERGSSS